MADRQKSAESIIPMILDVHPLILEGGTNLIQKLRESEKGEISFAERVARLRKEMALTLGIVFPSLSIRERASLQPDQYSLKVREVEVRHGELRNVSLVNVMSFLERELSGVVHQYAYEFLGTNEVQGLLNHLRSINSSLVQSVFPSLLNLQDIHRILQNLLREYVPVRDLVKIMETLSEYAPYTHDTEILTEYVRHSLSRVIGSLYQENSVIRGFVVDRNIEQLILGAIRWEEGVFLDIEPQAAANILSAITKKMHPVASKNEKRPVLFVSPDIRRYVRMLVERASPGLPVMSISEVSAEYRMKVLGTVRLGGWVEFLKQLWPPFWLPFGRKKDLEVFPGDNLQKAILILNLLGPASNQVGQYLTPAEKEALKSRAMIAPIPTQGKNHVEKEFISLIPSEKQVTGFDALRQLAEQEPFTIALVLQRNWLTHLEHLEHQSTSSPAQELRGRDETGPREKAAVFISSAARWVQEDVYRLLNDDDLRELGYGMLQFPFISPDGKRRAWDDYEGVLYKDEWWDSETLARFVQASMRGKIQDFKKRGFRRGQKLAILLLSLPAQRVMKIGKEVLDSLSKTNLQQILGEMGQWRDQLPTEARLAALQEFLAYVASLQSKEFQFSESYLGLEVERIANRDSKGVVSVMRSLWITPPDPWTVFESIATQQANRMSSWLLGYFNASKLETITSLSRKVSYFVNGIHPEARGRILELLSSQEKGLIESRTPPQETRVKLFREFLRAYYGKNYASPSPMFTRAN